jgi:hypothetical protein
VRFSADFLALWMPAPLHPIYAQWHPFREASQFMLEGYPEENVAYLGYTVLLLAILGLWRQRQAAYPIRGQRFYALRVQNSAPAPFGKKWLMGLKKMTEKPHLWGAVM